MPGNVFALRADRFAQTDFASALGDADEHDIHYAHAADQQSDGAENDHREVHHHHDVVKLRDFLLGRGDGKIIFAAQGNISAALQNFADLVDGGVQHFRMRLRAHVDLVGIGISFLERAVRDENAAVFIANAETALGFFDHADDLEGGTVDHHVFPDGMALGKQNGGDVFPEHDHFLFVKIIAFTDEAAFHRGGVGVNFAEVGLHAAEINRGDVAGFCAHDVVVAPIRLHKNRDVFYRGTFLLNRDGIFHGQGLALLLFNGWRTAVASLIPFGDEGGVRSELIDVFLNFLIEAGKQRGDQHNDADAQDHTEDRQGAAQLVRAERIHCLLQIFAVSLCHVRSSAVRAQRFDGIQLGCAHGWKNSKEESNRR